MDKLEGRFSQLLPTKVPDKGMRALALAMLKVKGIQTAKGGPVPPCHGSGDEAFSVFVFMDAITRLKNS